MNDMLKAYKSNLAKGVKFDIKFRSKKDIQQSVAVLNKHWLKKKGVFSFLRAIKSTKALPYDLVYDYDSRLIKTRTGHYCLCVTKPLETRTESQAPVFNETQKSKSAGVIAMDPGVRTFNTWFDPSGLIAEWGVGDKAARLGRLCHAYDDLQSSSGVLRKIRRINKEKMVYWRSRRKKIHKQKQKCQMNDNRHISTRRLQILQRHLLMSITDHYNSEKEDLMLRFNHVSSYRGENTDYIMDEQFSGSLAAERQNSTLNANDIRQLTYILDEGEKITKIKEYAMQLIERDPVFSQIDNYDKTFEELRVISMQKARKGFVFFENIYREMERLGLKKGTAERHVWDLLALSDPGTFTRLGIHSGLFLNAIKGQGHDELREKVVPLAESLKIYGCFAMTEMGHGSYLRGLETTATFDEANDEFIINSPTETSAKWWIGGAAHTATHAVVFAQLYIRGKNYGPHSFLVQLRSTSNHEPMMGVSLGDIGKKMGRDTIDNGWIQFTNVRIPRTNMLMKWAKVDRNGKYTPPPLAQLAYGAVVSARIDIVGQSAVDLSRAITIAIRYGCIRRQFHTSNKLVEQKILDYQSHQYRLFPYLCSIFAMHFAAARLYHTYRASMEEQERGIVSSKLPDLHNLSAGLKAFTTWLTHTGIESCRQACGGHGYSAYNGFAQMLNDFAVQQTWDGDNTVLTQQTSRYLLKTILAVSKGKVKADIDQTSVGYLKDLMNLLSEKCQVQKIEDFEDINIQLHALKYKSCKLLANTSLRVQKLLGSDRKRNMPLAWNECQVDLIACSKAHCYLYMAESFIETVKESKANEAVYNVLKKLCDLFVLHVCIEQDATMLMIEDYMSSKQFQMLQQKVRELMKDIRRDAVTIVDSFNLSDFILNSPIGTYDGQAYRKYFERVKKTNPIGASPPYYEKLIKNMIDPNIQL
jgi:acyl-CoA oxidase